MSEVMSETPATSCGQILRSSSIISGTNAISYLVGRKVGVLIFVTMASGGSHNQDPGPPGPPGAAWDARASGVGQRSEVPLRSCRA
jgi:hypothetical protein